MHAIYIHTGKQTHTRTCTHTYTHSYMHTFAYPHTSSVRGSGGRVIHYSNILRFLHWPIPLSIIDMHTVRAVCAYIYKYVYLFIWCLHACMCNRHAWSASKMPAFTQHAECNMFCATHCNTRQHTATHCNTLQHTAIHCQTLQNIAWVCFVCQHVSFRDSRTHSGNIFFLSSTANVIQLQTTHSIAHARCMQRCAHEKTHTRCIQDTAHTIHSTAHTRYSTHQHSERKHCVTHGHKPCMVGVAWKNTLQ